MDMHAAYREVGSYRAAAEICGTTPKTVKRSVEAALRAETGSAPGEVRHNYDGVATVVAETVARDQGPDLGQRSSPGPSAWATSTWPRPRPSTPPPSPCWPPAAISRPGDPVVLLGDSGTGKSHLLIGLGMAACEQGRAVRYTTCAALVNELVEAADERRLSRLVARYGRLDLLCLDELGYVQLDARGAELMFQILTEREEKASVATASNLPFSEWGQVIGDPRLVAAIVDRLTFNAHIIETGTESFRLRSTKAKRWTRPKG